MARQGGQRCSKRLLPSTPNFVQKRFKVPNNTFQKLGANDINLWHKTSRQTWEQSGDDWFSQSFLPSSHSNLHPNAYPNSKHWTNNASEAFTKFTSEEYNVLQSDMEDSKTGEVFHLVSWTDAGGISSKAFENRQQAEAALKTSSDKGSAALYSWRGQELRTLKSRSDIDGMQLRAVREYGVEFEAPTRAVSWLEEWRKRVADDKMESHYVIKLPDGKQVDFDDWMRSNEQRNIVSGGQVRDEHLIPQIDQLGRSYGKGSRKTAKAEVTIRPVALSGAEPGILVNGRHYVEYFNHPRDRLAVSLPLLTTDCIRRFEIEVTVRGGGTSGQANAVKLGIANALQAHNPHLRQHLEPYGLLTYDVRKKERKKPGRKKARKLTQWNRR